jgi:nucleoside-diphosphate-sugar epimerase
MAAELKAITDYPLEPVYGPAKLGETRNIYLDASRAGSRLGWEPGLDLRAGLQKTVAYFRSHELEI